MGGGGPRSPPRSPSPSSGRPANATGPRSRHARRTGQVGQTTRPRPASGGGEPAGRARSRRRGTRRQDGIGDDPYAYVAAVEPFHGNVLAVYLPRVGGDLTERRWRRTVIETYGEPNDAERGPPGCARTSATGTTSSWLPSAGHCHTRGVPLQGDRSRRCGLREDASVRAVRGPHCRGGLRRGRTARLRDDRLLRRGLLHDGRAVPPRVRRRARSPGRRRRRSCRRERPSFPAWARGHY